jgi:hypothetical protein
MKAKTRYPTHEEMLRMERRWTVILCICLLVLAGAGTDLALMSPQGVEETACYWLMALSLLGALYAVDRLCAAIRGDAPDVPLSPKNPMENPIELLDD